MERQEDTARPTRRLIRYARPVLPLVVVVALLGVLAGTAEYGRAYLLKLLIDEVALPTGTDVDPKLRSWLPDLPFLPAPEAATASAEPALEPADRDAIARSVVDHAVLIVGLAALIALALPALGFLREYLAEFALGRIQLNMAREVCAKLLALPLRYHHEHRQGDVYTRAVSDLRVAHGALSLLFSDVLQAALSVLTGVVFLLFVSWQLSLALLAIAPGMFAVISLFGRRIERSARKRQAQVSEVTQHLLEILQGIKVIKAFRAEAAEQAAYSREQKRLFRRSMRVVKNRILARSLVELVNHAATLTGLLLGLYMLWAGLWGMTLGSIAAFFAISSLTYRPLKKLAKGWVRVVDSQAAARRYFEVLDAPDDVLDAPDAEDLPPVARGVAMRGVWFGYGDEPVLRDISFEAAAGQVVAIVGPTGAGKTTLVDLLLRFYDPQEGRVEIDGRDLRGVTRSSLLAQVGVVTQEPFLFDGSIRENLRYGRPDATDDEVLAAARTAHVDEFARDLPEGYGTEVGPAGVRLSGGQRQRIALGRAILKDPAILVLDEATSALDSKSEKYVQDAIDRLMAGRTVFVVAHRLSTVRRADRILVLEQGRIVQQGSHEELLASGGLYRELVELQATPAAS